VSVTAIEGRSGASEAALRPGARTWQRAASNAATIFAFGASALLLAYLVVLPIGFMLFESLTDDTGRFSLAGYMEVFGRNYLLQAFVNTILAATGVAVFSVLIGTPLAFGVSRTNMWGKSLVRAAIIIAVISPPFLMTIAYIQLAGPNTGYLNQLLRSAFGLEQTYGPLNIFTIWAFVLLSVPNGVAFVFLQLVPAFNNMDPSLEEAARMMGGNARRTFVAITLPLMAPAMLSGALLAFSMALAIYGTAHILNLNVITMAIREALLLTLDFKTAATLSVTVVAISLLALYGYRLTIRVGKKYQTLGGRGFRRAPTDVGGARHLLGLFGVVFAVVTSIVPYGLMLVTSFYKAAGQGITAENLTFQNYLFLLHTPFIRDALLNSFLLAFCTATLVVILGFCTGYFIVRTRFPGRALLDYISILPLGVAGTALAAGIVIVHLNEPFRWLGLYGTLWIMLVAYMARFVAFGVRSSQTALLQISTELEEAARVHGATSLTSVFLIVLPLVRRALLYSWILVFILAFPEVSASVVLRGVNTDVAATALLEVWDGTGGLPLASALGMTIFAAIGIPMLILQSLGGSAIPDARG
jgi:iron(III) transport system permease protein